MARLARAPKNCICLPTSIGDTQQAIAPSSPHARRMISSLSNWSELVSIATFAAKRRKPSGSRGEYQIGEVRLRRRARGCRASAASGSCVLVTSDRPSSPMPPIDSVTHVGSPANSSSYSGRAQEADDAQLDDEVVDDLLRLLLGERARREVALEVDVEERRACGPSDIAAPFCSFTAAR